MFDGNFRSRREVNLGGNRRGGTKRRGGGTSNSSSRSSASDSSGKTSILKQAEEQRKQRQESLRRDRASRKIQRTVRGWETRNFLAQNTLANYHHHRQVPSPSAVALRLDLTPSSNSLKRQEILVEYARDLLASTLPRGSTTTAEWFSHKRIAQVALQQLSKLLLPSKFGDDKNNSFLQPTFEILQNHFRITEAKYLNRVDLYLDLISCAKSWWNYSFFSEARHLEQSQSSSEPVVMITKSLMEWSAAMTTQLQQTTPYAQALLSSIPMTTSSVFDPAHASRLQELLPTNIQPQEEYYSTFFLPLATIFDTQSPADKCWQATISAIGGQELVVLSNALELCQQIKSTTSAPQALIHLLHHVLRERSDLALMASLVVRGESLESSPASLMVDSMESSTQDGHSDDDSDDDDDDETMLDSTSRPTKTTRRGGSRYTRQELMTVVKLDKLYQDQILMERKECLLKSPSPNLISVASQIGGSSKTTWLPWGLSLLPESSSHPNYTEEGVTSMDTSSDSSASILTSYMDVLSILMKGSNCLKSNSRAAGSQFLSQLAFSRPFLERLWNYVQRPGIPEAHVSVFCELIVQYFMALSDVEFLQYHSKMAVDSASFAPSSILAHDLIERLKELLHSLYWANPVLVSDIQSSNGRGRLLLSGTKLWNALYDRWNRLYRHAPFCDESAWWFPYLSSREDGAVIPARENRPDEEDDMEIVDSDDDDNSRNHTELSAAEAETDALAGSFRDPKMARVLTSIPQALPFDRRVKLFSSLLKADKLKTQDEAAETRRALLAMMQQDGEEPDFGGIREKVQIRRASLYDDSMEQLNKLGTKLKRKVQVSFINQHGAEEAGIDGGGVFKEFLDDLIKDGFAAQQDGSGNGSPQLFAVTPLQTLAVHPAMSDNFSMLPHYEFLGRVLGKAVYESILVEPQFCLPFLNTLLGKPNSLEDLKNFDPEYYKNLTKLRYLSKDEIDSLGLTFEISLEGARGSHPRSVELLPGGRNKPVTKQNVIQYIFLVAHQRLNVQGAPQTRAFLKGFRDLIPASWVRLFSAIELQKLIGGDDSVRGIDVASLKRSMQYAGGYHPSQPIIESFWEIIDELTPEQQRLFLKFMTSCSRQPLLGFSSLQPAPCIQQIRIPEAEISKNSRLPTSSTCMNLLKLPNYQRKDLMKEKLIAAIESGAGFELT